MAQEAQLALDDLAWMGINLHGTRLEVSVRETIPPAEGVDESGCWDVVAKTAGLITHIEAERGQAKVIEGDTVAAGEVLIAGNVAMEPAGVQRPAHPLFPHPRPGPGVGPDLAGP